MYDSSIWNIGLVAMPTTMFSNTQLECTICNKNLSNCGFMMDQIGVYRKGCNPIDSEKNVSDPNHNGAWVNKFCTMTAINSFILYFPYGLILIPLLLIFLHKGFDK